MNNLNEDLEEYVMIYICSKKNGDKMVRFNLKDILDPVRNKADFKEIYI